MAAARVRVSARGEKGGEEEQQVAGVSFILQGGQDARGATVDAVVGRGHGDSELTVAPGRRREGERLTRVAHCQGFVFFQISEIPVGFRQLIEAHNHF